jgi:hypothetical protein
VRFIGNNTGQAPMTVTSPVLKLAIAAMTMLSIAGVIDFVYLNKS